MSELRAGAPITVAGMTLVPIERLRVDAGEQFGGCWCNATKEAVAVVICDPAGPRAVDVQARECPIEEFLHEIPELAAIVARCCST